MISRLSRVAVAAMGAFVALAAVPSRAATPVLDYGIDITGATLNLSNSLVSNSAKSSATLSGFSTSGDSGPTVAGSFGGTSYGTSLNFNLYGIGFQPVTAISYYTTTIPGPNGPTIVTFPTFSQVPAFDTATLTLNYRAISGTPILTLVSTSAGQNGIAPVGAAGIFGQQLALQPSGPGTLTYDLGSSFARNLSNNLAGSLGGKQALQIVATATGGAGVPGPVAGGGLPILAVAGGIAFLSRRRAARLA